MNLLILAQEQIVGYNGKIIFDATKPDGTPRKLMDVSKLTSLDWRYSIDLKTGLRDIISNNLHDLD
jgi:GDP-L-fucose synthase